mgnify:CR=1 FL=1
MAKAAVAKHFLFAVVGLILLILIGVAVWYYRMFMNRSKVEGFSSSSISSGSGGSGGSEPSAAGSCPKSAERKEDGKIHVEPQGLAFDTMNDYIIWLSGLNNTAICIPPYVKNTATAPAPGPGPGSGPDREIGALPKTVEKQNTFGNVFTTQVEGEHTYAKTPINKMDDYEYTRIFQNESSPRGELSRTTVNSLTAQNQFDWAKLPFNSQTRADYETEFVSERMDGVYRDPKTGVFFKNMEGMSVEPPDADAIDAAEKASLEAFKSEAPEKLLLQHDTEDIASMVKKMYENDPNWEPVVEHVGANNYRVSELRPRARKEKYAGHEEETIERAALGGLVSPQVVIENEGTDPYFDKKGVLDYTNDRFHKYDDFKKWTPGLERMFAPTLDTGDWL